MDQIRAKIARMKLHASIVPMLTLCLALLLSVTNSPTVGADSYNQLPSIWQSAITGSYHLLYQLEVANSDKMLTLEEWASYNRRLFRLDLISAGGRTTYLTNGKTGELFRYSPFVCERIPEDSEDLETIRKLFFGYQWADVDATGAKPDDAGASKPISAYGLGPLWLRASHDAERVVRKGQQLNPRAEHEEFEVTMRPNLLEGQSCNKLRFYFAEGVPDQLVDFIDWVAPPGAESRGAGPDEVIQARAKVIQVDHEIRDESVFNIPVGFGCSRRPDQELALDIDVGLMLLHQGTPNQATFEVITSRPEAAGDSHLGSWISQRYSMRMMRLSKSRLDSVDRTESYFSTLMQFSSALAARPHLNRLKRVWWAPDSERGQATVYTMDLGSGECQVDHQDVRNQILLDFGGLHLSPLASRGPGALERDDGDQQEGVLAGPLVLSMDQISFLFADNEDYHLVDLGETIGLPATSQHFRNRVYEKRVHNFKLTGEGGPSWEGPVSIVKQISTHSHLLDVPVVWPRVSTQNTSEGANRTQALKLSTDFRQTLVIFFYSKDMSQLMYKTVIELLDNHEVSLEYAHEQLDVSSCFADDAKQQVVVKYPLQSAELARELQEKEPAIRGQVFSRLFTELGSAFSTLQIYSIEPSFDVFNMRIQMGILDMPPSHTFQLELGLKLVSSGIEEDAADDEQSKMRAGLSEREPAPALAYTTASSADACAQHCEHYNCLRFSYDPSSYSCHIELVRARTTAIPWPSSQLFTWLERRETKALQLERVHLSADSIVEYMSELVDAAQMTTGDLSGGAPPEAENPLVRRLNLRPNLVHVNDADEEKERERSIVTLRPSALEHDLENMQEYSRELEESASATSDQQVVRVSGRSIRLQYNILLEDYVLEGDTRELTGLTFEDCQRHCETQDCRSFSYCQRDETCRVNWQHQEKLIRANSRRAPHPWQCNIYSLDNLSKFEAYGRVEPPLRVTSSEPALTARECASACMYQQNYQCQGFYFCNLPTRLTVYPDTLKCYLIDRHVNTMLEHEALHWLKPARVPESGQRGECDFFSRSYLAQFDKYFARRLDPGRIDEMGVAIHAGHNLESCAKQCIKLNCLAFDACPESGDSLGAAAAARGRQTQCRLAFKSIRASQLLGEQRCTTFVLSDKSQFNSQKVKLIQDQATAGKRDGRPPLGPDREANIGRGRGPGVDLAASEGLPPLSADINGRELELLESYRKLEEDAHGPLADAADGAASHWLAKLCSLSLGVLLGFACILGWSGAYARGWLDQARARFL